MKILHPLMFLAALLLVTGCSASSPSVTYYLLSPMDYQTSSDRQSAVGTLEISGTLVLGLGPIRLPAYLDRPQMVSRTGANRLKVDDFHRWAAPLPGEISRILADDLEKLTGIQHYKIYPWAIQQRPDLAVELEIQAFEGQSDGSVILNGFMVIYDFRHGEPKSRSRTFRISQEAVAGDYAAMVAAQSRSLGELSRQIAGEILGLISK